MVFLILVFIILDRISLALAAIAFSSRSLKGIFTSRSVFTIGRLVVFAYLPLFRATGDAKPFSPYHQRELWH